MGGKQDLPPMLCSFTIIWTAQEKYSIASEKALRNAS